MSHSRPWLVSCLAALVVFATPLLAAGALTKAAPEIRFIRTGESMSALVVTDQERLLIINSDDRGVTRSALGRLARPWEPATTTLLAPADDDAAIGLWEALRDPRIRQVIVVGVPGRDPIWSRIERECVQRGVEIEYVIMLSHVELTDATLTIEPTGMTVSVRSRGTVVAIALTNQPPSLAANVAVVNDLATLPPEADLVLAASFPNEVLKTPVVRVNDRETVRLVFQPMTVRVQGGSVSSGEPRAN